MLLLAPVRIIQTVGRLTEENKNIERMQKKKKSQMSFDCKILFEQCYLIN